ncbi:hypothetical protein AUC68_00585 [Methyloceanibacter methanicus]|uniref:Uncharacterized protein n=1 Tax=Methyloceanibacter methanicus TaxID=1774968 RepID=A0A1E3W6H4_9HYPH|nr:hypothetical protein [Methyloceanibacter methanicus]ODS01391.1 hypothetical protein AUC68_00585 [Methyloceanibacter methanicus]
MSDETGPGAENRMGRQSNGPFGGDYEAPEGAGMHAQGALPFGWYYYGPEPPAFPPYGNAGYGAAGAPGMMHGGVFGPAGDPYRAGPGADAYASHDRNAAYKEAFDRLSRGHVDADTIGKLLSLDDDGFWKGALIGAGAALLATNLPTLKTMFAGAFTGAAGAGKNGGTAAAQHAPEPGASGGPTADDKEKKE